MGTNPGTGSATEYVQAIKAAIDMGAAVDSKLLKAGVEAHHKAIGSAGSGVTSQADFEGVNAALGRMIASVPESKTMDVYDSFSKLVAPEVPNYLMASVKEADAKKAYEALMKFKDVVKANPITPAAASAPSGGKIDEAAAALTKAAYPLMKEVDWTSNLYLKKPGSVAAKDALAAVDKALVMGAAMDSGALKEAALAHVKAIAAVPTSKVMDVYNAFGKVVSADVPNYLIRTVNAGDARAAYSALMEFKDVVKASR